jgi:hypothetical protein
LATKGVAFSGPLAVARPLKVSNQDVVCGAARGGNGKAETENREADGKRVNKVRHDKGFLKRIARGHAVESLADLQ